MDNLTYRNNILTSTAATEEVPSAGRRRLLQMGGAAAVAGTAAALLGRSSAAGAAPGDGLHVTTSDADDAIVGEATSPAGGRGVVGTGVGGAGVSGIGRGNAPAVRALADRGSRGSALAVGTEERANQAPTIDVRQRGGGDAVDVHIDNAANSNRALFARTFGTGIAFVGAIANPRSTATATKGSTIGYGAGVEGQSVYGVGGRFAGKTAQVHLVPAAASSHPETGEAGQLFVDKANRLWYCRGSRDWRRLA
jgi:hypothetical protein